MKCIVNQCSLSRYFSIQSELSSAKRIPLNFNHEIYHFLCGINKIISYPKCSLNITIQLNVIEQTISFIDVKCIIEVYLPNLSTAIEIILADIL